MMKNKMMRAASILLVAVLLSTCAISGTFAKYVTTASGTDTARVAKWGITMSNKSSDTFVAEYKNGENLTVQGKKQDGSADDVVAPGTTSTVTYRVDGTPETDYVISFDYSDVKEVFLKAGTVFTYTNLDANDDNAIYDAGMSTGRDTIQSDYYPIKYQVVLTTELGTVSYSDNTGNGNTPFEKTSSQGNTTLDTYTYSVVGKLTDALEQLKKTTIAFDANEKCDAEVKITWTWAFEKGNDAEGIDQNAHINNAYDTILGDLAAKKAGADVDLTTTATEANGDYSLTVAYTLKMTATQVD